MLIHKALAAPFDGGDVKSGLGIASGINLGSGFTSGDPIGIIRSLLFFILTFTGLAGVLMLVIAGIILVIGGYSDSARERAKKIVIYTVIGLIVIVLSTTLVSLVIFLIS